MSKRIANRRGPSKNKGAKNVGRKAVRAELNAARHAEDKSWFRSTLSKLRSMK
jgi:hypothetical protein